MTVTHKVSRKDMIRAFNSRLIRGFWNPAVEPVQTLCRTEPGAIASGWGLVTCKRCKKRRDLLVEINAARKDEK